MPGAIIGTVVSGKKSDYGKTLDVLNSELLEKSGGYLVPSHAGGRQYIDYVSNVGNVNSQKIEFSKNLLDFSRFIDASEVITALIPLGKDGLTIRTVGYDSDYVYDPLAVNLYGFIIDTKEFADIDNPVELQAKGIEYLQSRVRAQMTIELSAFDLSLINVEMQRIKLGDSLRCISKPHELDDFLVVSKKVRYLTEPHKDRITLGNPIPSSSETAAKEKKKAEALLKKANKLETASKNLAINSIMEV